MYKTAPGTPLYGWRTEDTVQTDRQTRELQAFPEEPVRRHRKQLPECVHLSPLKETLRCGGKKPYTRKVLRKPPK